MTQAQREAVHPGDAGGAPPRGGRWRASWGRRWRRLRQQLGFRHWFPHLPLGLAQALLGLLVFELAYGGGWARLMAEIPKGLTNVHPSGIAFLLIG
ncbi:MAG TPA: hypothetical protein VNE83_01170, partial [Terriglobales bacterium]|nr:hypothetical protein [Terriglobales bacterium]